MTATDELRRLLDERGAKWYECGGAVFWETHDGAFRYRALPHKDALKVMTCCSQRSTVMTAAQAIEATLGRGTCRNEWPDHFAFRCSECGGSWYGVGLDARPYPRFCPNCGCEVSRDEQ